MTLARIFLPLHLQPLEYRHLDAAYRLMAGHTATAQICYFQHDLVPAGAASLGLNDLTELTTDALAIEAKRFSLDAEMRARDWAGQHDFSYSVGADLNDGTRVSFEEFVGHSAERVIQMGRLSDLIICSKELIAESSSLITSSVFETGRPILAIPRETYQSFLQHILIAWDGSLAAARLVSQILPIVRMAQRVSIFSYPEGDCNPSRIGDLAAYLRCHNIDARKVQVRDDVAISDAIVASTLAHEVSLVAMGCYGHSRTREVLFGGLTRHMLRHVSLPLLLTH